MERLKAHLAKGGSAETAMIRCRKQKRFTHYLEATHHPAAVYVANAFERLCQRDVPLAWLRQRFTRTTGPAIGPLTCRRASLILGELVARFPDDPMIHLATALHTSACGARRARTRRLRRRRSLMQ